MAAGNYSEIGRMFVFSADPVLALTVKAVAAGRSSIGAAQKSTTGVADVVAWPEVVIFDCDGVLVDSETIALDQTRKALAAAGLHLTEAQALDRFLGRRLDTVVHLAQAQLGVRLPDDFSDILTRDILARFEKELKGVAGVRQAVAGLPSRVCVASSSGPERIRQSLALAGYEGLFSPNIFSASMVAHGKPQPDIFLHAAREMGVAAGNCLVIEDSVAGLQAASGAGMEAFAFVGGSHFMHASNLRSLAEAGALLTFDDMAQLPALVAARERQRQEPKARPAFEPEALAREARQD
jgi:HAD superfamily hydrolase (TIGR01509 family)